LPSPLALTGRRASPLRLRRYHPDSSGRCSRSCAARPGWPCRLLRRLVGLRAVRIFPTFCGERCPKALPAASCRSVPNSSLGVCPKICPSIDICTACPLPAWCVPEGSLLTFGTGLQCPVHVPSLSFLPTSTVFSTLCSASLFHPAADHGVRHVSGVRVFAHPEGTVASAPAVSRVHFRSDATPKSSPGRDSLASRPNRASRPAASARSNVLPHPS
jgi:hypothetical protein